MKHIKLFEGYLDGEFFEVQESDWKRSIETYGINHEIYEKDLICLGKEFPEIKIVLTTHQWWFYFDSDRFPERMYTRIIQMKPRGKTEKRVYICHSSDEWYYVSAGVGKRVKYWKCDQLYGLVEFLKTFFK